MVAPVLERLLPPCLVLLLISCVGRCQLTVEQNAECDFRPADWNLTATAGAQISISCDRNCVQKAVGQNRNRKGNVIGADIYSLSSEPCVAAIHDARLAYPSRWTDQRAVVQLRVDPVQDAVPRTFRRGIRTIAFRKSQEYELGFVFVSKKVSEAVPTLTTVHQFRFEEGANFNYVECHAPAGTDLSKIKIFRQNGREYSQRSLTLHEDADRGNFKEVRTSRPESWVTCWREDTLYSDLTTFGFIDRPAYEPSRLFHRANVGDRIVLGHSSFAYNPPFWYKDGMGQSVKEQKYVIEHAKTKDAGLYELRDGGTADGASVTSVIIRGCPAGHFGERCQERCPYCLHGGQCHDVTGICVCPPGFTGERCQTSCGKGMFGANCSSSCPDADACRARLLCVPEPLGCGCASGYRGTFCNEECESGSYGPDCSASCGRCKDGQSCNRFTGECEEGCQLGFEEPLCLDLPPWFRNLPTLLGIGYTTATIMHATWFDGYDNGFGSGRYSYRAQFRRNGTSDQWSSAGNADNCRLGFGGLGDNVMCELKGLKADTAYLVRIVIRDDERGTTTSDDNKVPAITIMTDCQEPGFISQLNVTDITSTSTTVIIGPLSNENTVCGYTLAWSVRSASVITSSGVGTPSAERTEISLDSLRPYTNYDIIVVARNRKGNSSGTSKTFQTNEAAPSRVVGLNVTQVSGLTFVVYWEQPRQLNGVIRRYMVTVQHARHRACPETAGGAGVEYSTNTSVTFVRITVSHPFSTYMVSVTASTIAPGPVSTEYFDTEAQVPSAGVIDVQKKVAGETYAVLSWRLPNCETWNDDPSSLRLEVSARGASRWNLNTQQNVSFESFQHLRSEGQLVDLEPYSNYTALLSLSNTVGHVQELQVINITTKPRDDGPGSPTRLTVLLLTSTSITVGWDHPSPPYCRIAGYRVACYGPRCRERRQDIVPEREACSADSFSVRDCSADITNLAENEQYTIQVSAYCNDVQRLGPAIDAKGTTQEGKPGPPRYVRSEGLKQLTVLNISWASPVQRNGVLLGYRLDISDDTELLKSIEINVAAGEIERLNYYVMTGLSAGHRYQVSVSARTRAGWGDASTVWLETRVPPPEISGRPEVGAVTDTTVELQLPPVTAAGGDVSRYFVIVSGDPDFDGRELEAIPGYDLPNAREAREQSRGFYVAAVPDKGHVESNKPFVVGDGKHYNTSDKVYYNEPLQTGRTYQFGIAALSKLSDDNLGLNYRAVRGGVTVRAPTAIGTIIGILFALMLTLLLVIGVVVCRRRIIASKREENKRKATAGQVSLEPLAAEKLDVYDPPEEPASPEAIYENLKPVHINQTRVALPELIEVTKNTELLHAQISSLPSGLARPCEYGRLMQNRSKNRYGNLIAYDDSRVVLEKLADDEFSDYINANYVDGYERSRAYIATQGPKPQTIFDFWRMMWEKRAARIVMLTNLVEGDKRKCDLYWPEDGSPLQLLGLTVSKEGETMSSDYVIRTFSMVRDEERRMVTQLHYTAWPDHSVPLYPSSLAKFMRELDTIPDREGPTVVHCSAGVGRTGTVILIDSMYKMGRREQAVDVYSHLAVIRQQRANLCASLPQYQLVHQVLIELLVSPSTAVPAAQLAARLPQLKSVAGGPSELEQQLTYLDTNPPQVSFSSLRGEHLEGKNRSPEILPEDKSRVFLHGNPRDNYINAVYVQGFKKPDAFIATEAPLPARRNMFWQMVVQKQSQTIVVMNDLHPEDVFWPTADEPVVFGKISVQVKSRTPGLVETIHMTLTTFNNGQKDSTRDVQMFVLPLDAADDGLPSAGDIVSLHAAYERSTPASHGGATVVVCRTGVTGCGLFIASCFIIARIAEEQEVNVVMAVSTVRKSRPQFIATLKQFELCYDIALAWLEAFDIYSNFH